MTSAMLHKTQALIGITNWLSEYCEDSIALLYILSSSSLHKGRLEVFFVERIRSVLSKRVDSEFCYNKAFDSLSCTEVVSS